MSVELHIRTRGSLKPDPEWDPVLTIFYYVHHDYPHSSLGGHSKISFLGVIAIDMKNSNFQTVHSSKQTKGKSSTRKPSPWQQIPTKSPVKSPKKQPIKLSDDKVPQNGAANFQQSTTNQDKDCTLGSIGVHSSRISNSPVVTKGYVSGCVSGEDVEVKYVSSEEELLQELVTTVRRLACMSHN